MSGALVADGSVADHLMEIEEGKMMYFKKIFQKVRKYFWM